MEQRSFGPPRALLPLPSIHATHSLPGSQPTLPVRADTDLRAAWPPFARTPRPASWLNGRFTAHSLSRTLEAAGFRDVRIDAALGGLGLYACATRP